MSPDGAPSANELNGLIPEICQTCMDHNNRCDGIDVLTKSPYKGYECLWDVGDDPESPTATLIDDLNAQVRFLEAQIEKLKANLETKTPVVDNQERLLNPTSNELQVQPGSPPDRFQPQM
ncbi:hypothetical protein FRC12_012696 [Ceratobasidium sp. 428]|nr:hypothetical protein FRC12_012696 [Ceratobasidium sp. 428]